MSRVRVGILGGTFDPIHQGHLRMARAAERACQLDRVYFAPAAHPIHKEPPLADYPDRFAMVALALARHPRWLPLNIPATAPVPGGGRRGAQPTFASDQLDWLNTHHPGQQFFWIIGADSFATLPSWKRYRRLFGLCDFIVLARAGFDLPTMLKVLPRALLSPSGKFLRSGAAVVVPLANRRRLFWLPAFASAVSSTGVRERLRRPSPGADEAGWLPAAVAQYARRARLYS